MWVRKNILQQTDDDIEEINAQMEQENAILAQQQQQQMMADQEAQAMQQQQDMQNQIQHNAQQQIAQAQVQKEVDKINPEQGQKELVNKSHEATMMDKKIELEKIKSKKSSPAKKKTISEEARDLGLSYIGNNRYVNTEGKVTHVASQGKLITINE